MDQPTPPQPPTLAELVKKKGKVTFIVELKVLDKVVRAPLAAVSQESLSHMAAIMVATNWPNVNGYNIYNADGTEILEMVDVIQFTNHFMKSIQAIAGSQILRSAIPVVQVGPEGKNLQELMEEARKAGRLIGGGTPSVTPPPEVPQKLTPQVPPAAPPAAPAPQVPPAPPKPEGEKSA